MAIALAAAAASTAGIAGLMALLGVFTALIAGYTVIAFVRDKDAIKS